MADDPEISVIIIAHNRRAFILDAIESAKNQSIHKELYEVIIVKNYHDFDIDKRIEQKGFKNIYTNAENLGEKCAIGIEASKGEIISFLEDDDLFSLRKLEKVRDVFKNRRTVYYHNDHILIDGKGNKLNGKMFRKSLLTGPVEINSGEYKNIRKLLKEGAFFNLSSISVRKDIITPKLQYLKKLNVAADNLMFYTALSSGGLLYIDNEELTMYRVHSTNDSMALGLDNGSIISSASSFLERDIYGYQVILSSVAEPFLIDVLSCRILAPEINLRIISNKRNEGTRYSFVTGLKCVLKLRYRELLILIAVDLISRLFPGYGPKVYSFYQKYRYSHLLR